MTDGYVGSDLFKHKLTSAAWAFGAHWGEVINPKMIFAESGLIKNHSLAGERKWVTKDGRLEIYDENGDLKWVSGGRFLENQVFCITLQAVNDTAVEYILKENGDVFDSTPKIFDCFTFFNEIEILELRFSELYNEVDHFVVCESAVTFTGKPKPLYFQDNKHKFEKYLDKIIHLVVDDFPETNDPWVREYHQRDSLRRGLSTAKDQDIVFISDVDEIIRPEVINRCRYLDGHVQLNMDMYQFYLNLRASQGNWSAAFGFTWRYRDLMADFSRARWVKDEVISRFGEKYQLINNAGWHFTHLGGVENVRQKFKSYSHANDPWPQAMLRDGALEKHILSGGSVGNFKDQSEFIRIDGTYPGTITRDLGHYIELGYVKDIFDVAVELQRELLSFKKLYALEAYDDEFRRPALGGLKGAEFLRLTGVESLFVSKVSAQSPPQARLLSRHKPATQSSLSQWSLGKTVESDALGAVDGEFSGGGKFHTDFEHQPWWMVDLCNIAEISEIRIYNRIYPSGTYFEILHRAAKFKIQLAELEGNFFDIFKKNDDHLFGGVDGRPFVVKFNPSLRGRFLKISLLDSNYLHLDQVEVYGDNIDGDIKKIFDT